ncbi:hypothetical protein B0H14DRAFT_3147577 [Mycena olivaceomarginata]|nr:hypothetical protein B0H14DRAFT_3147577 [Mycena olivaceomarginata]
MSTPTQLNSTGRSDKDMVCYGVSSRRGKGKHNKDSEHRSGNSRGNEDGKYSSALLKNPNITSDTGRTIIIYGGSGGQGGEGGNTGGAGGTGEGGTYRAGDNNLPLGPPWTSCNPNILWLSGVAGSGKSAIAASVAEHFRGLNGLGAFILCNRKVPTHAGQVLQTIAYKLAEFNPEYIGAEIYATLEKKRGIVNEVILTQFEELLLLRSPPLPLTSTPLS